MCFPDLQPLLAGLDIPIDCEKFHTDLGKNKPELFKFNNTEGN